VVKRGLDGGVNIHLRGVGGKKYLGPHNMNIGKQVQSNNKGSYSFIVAALTSYFMAADNVANRTRTRIEGETNNFRASQVGGAQGMNFNLEYTHLGKLEWQEQEIRYENRAAPIRGGRGGV